MKLIYYSHGNRSKNKIALTFDDGPNPFFTEEILKILERYNVKATFFILGKWAIKYPAIVKKIFSAGHLIGNHSYSHLKGDFEKADEIIQRIIGESPNFIKPPYLNLAVCSKLNLKNRLNIKIITFDIDSSDYTYISARKIITLVKKQVQNGSIIGLHDSSENEKELKNRPIQTVKALPNLIKILKKDFILVRVDRLSLVPAIYEMKNN